MVEIQDPKLLDRVMDRFHEENGYSDLEQIPGWLRAHGWQVRVCRDEWQIWFRFDDDQEAVRFCLFW